MSNLSQAIAQRVQQQLQAGDPTFIQTGRDRQTTLGRLKQTSSVQGAAFTVRMTQQGGDEQAYRVIVRPTKSRG